MNKHERKYLRRVRRWLPCRRGMKGSIMARITARVEEWCQANPACTYPELEAHFGAPQQIAAAYIENVDSGELLRDLHIKRRVVNAVSVALVTAVLVWAIGVTVAVVDHMMDTRYGYETFETHIIEGK